MNVPQCRCVISTLPVLCVIGPVQYEHSITFAYVVCRNNSSIS